MASEATFKEACKILEALGPAYAMCERAEMLLIVLDALDQAGAPLDVQARVHNVLLKWDPEAALDASDFWATQQIATSEPVAP